MSTTIARISSSDAGKVGLVLSGGGARGPFQVGVYERLLRDRRFAEGPAMLSGTSAGALNAAMIAADLLRRRRWCWTPPGIASARLFGAFVTLAVGLRGREPAWHCLEPRASERRATASAGAGLSTLALDYLLTSRFDLVSRSSPACASRSSPRPRASAIA
jgi:hypothetical protein